MIQLDVKRFRVPEECIPKLPGSSLLSDRVDPISYSSVQPTLRGLRERVFGNLRRSRLSGPEQRLINDLVLFLHDLYVAAEFRRPVVTVLDVPNVSQLQPLLKEDLYVVVEALLSAVERLKVDSPVARIELQADELESFQTIMLSDVFESYVDSYSALEVASGSTNRVVERVSENAHKIVHLFRDRFDLRKTAVGAIRALPPIVEATAGKVFGAVTKPVLTAFAEALTQNRRLLVYSFHPTWRQIWGGKLDKARRLVEEERRQGGGVPG
jgi:hypothetical protein